jgi:hypothetical protein
MHAEGHQVASHTWSHQNASQLTDTQFTNQMVWNEIAFNSILGFFPTYMRPPYSICERNCQTILSRLGYHVIYFDLDTEGYLHDSRTEIQTSKDIWDEAVDGSDPAEDSFLQIEHDIHYQTVYNLTDYVLTSLFSAGYRSVTVGECLGDPPANWYHAGPSGSISSAVPSGSSTTSKSAATTATRTTVSVAPTRTGVSTNGSCGNGVTCTGGRFGPCCSAFGYCGSGDDYCSLDNGCQVAWGSCDGDGTDETTTIATRSSTIIRCKQEHPSLPRCFSDSFCFHVMHEALTECLFLIYFSSHHHQQIHVILQANTNGRRRSCDQHRRPLWPGGQADMHGQQVRQMLQLRGQMQLQHNFLSGDSWLSEGLWVLRLKS